MPSLDLTIKFLPVTVEFDLERGYDGTLYCENLRITQIRRRPVTDPAWVWDLIRREKFDLAHEIFSNEEWWA